MPLETPITKRRSSVGLKRANNGGLPIAARRYCTKNFFAPPGCPRWSNNTWNPKGVLKPKYEYMLPLYPDRKWGVPAIHMVVSELRQYAKANNRTDILEAVPPYTDPRPKLGHEARVASLRAKALAEGRQDVLDAVPEMTPENIERWQAFEEILEDQTEADADEKKTKLKGKVATEMVVTEGLGDLVAGMNFSLLIDAMSFEPAGHVEMPDFEMHAALGSFGCDPLSPGSAAEDEDEAVGKETGEATEFASNHEASSEESFNTEAEVEAQVRREGLCLVRNPHVASGSGVRTSVDRAGQKVYQARRRCLDAQSTKTREHLGDLFTCPAQAALQYARWVGPELSNEWAAAGGFIKTHAQAVSTPLPDTAEKQVAAALAIAKAAFFRHFSVSR